MLLLIAIFTINNIWQYFAILSMAYLNLMFLTKKIKYKIITLFILVLTPALVGIFLSSYLFAINTIFIAKIDTALLLTMRYFCLTVISFTFAIHTQFTLVFNYLIEKKILSVKIGYAIFAALSSFYFLGEEFNKIQTAYKMRYNKTSYSPIILIALLTTAARYAHNLSISMYVRGINNHKTFVYSSKNLNFIDCILCIVNLAIIFIILHG
jgi:energy-coupling factor transporter transmembrane protein EcfT